MTWWLLKAMNTGAGSRPADSGPLCFCPHSLWRGYMKSMARLSTCCESGPGKGDPDQGRPGCPHTPAGPGFPPSTFTAREKATRGSLSVAQARTNPDCSPCLLGFSLLPGLAPHGTGTSAPEVGERRSAQLAFPSALPQGLIQLYRPTAQFLSQVQSL